MKSLRSFLYRFASFLGDIQAVAKGPKAIAKRAIRKQAYKASNKATRTVLKGVFDE